MENVVLSDHRAVLTAESVRGVVDVVTANLDAFFSGRPLLSPRRSRHASLRPNRFSASIPWGAISARKIYSACSPLLPCCRSTPFCSHCPEPRVLKDLKDLTHDSEVFVKS
ncbi:hypothetical protein GUJ93_ZPchr0004g39560 [Zizania palustris]|uniref:Uncharacterized protein n=1 Tax=Zizania palustris TaxID=103762 RepID=A0A8J5V860_ZIZPA|nr:hypothetical protein GUJ93_ZPchr0004g39560 [Zizania palustris]